MLSKIHIISNGNKWAVYKPKAKRALRVFKHREIAFYYASNLADIVIVHNKKGEVDFEMMKSVMDVRGYEIFLNSLIWLLI